METIELIYGVLVGYGFLFLIIFVMSIPCMLTFMMYLKIEKWIKARKELMERVRAIPERFDELQKEIYMLETRLRCQEAEALRRR
jgi:hypothetical protein